MADYRLYDWLLASNMKEKKTFIPGKILEWFEKPLA